MLTLLRAGFVALISLASANVLAGGLLEAQYAGAFNSNNSYTSSAGTSYSNSGSVDLRFLGLGGRYIFESVGSERLNLEGNVAYFLAAQDKSTNDISILELGLGASLNFGPHKPFAGLLYSQFYESNSPLNIRPDLGYQLGYRYEFGPHSIFANLSWRKLRSDNAPSVNDQRTTISMWSVGYGYQIF